MVKKFFLRSTLREGEIRMPYFVSWSSSFRKISISNVPLIKFVALMIGIFLKTSGEVFFSGMVKKKYSSIKNIGSSMDLSVSFYFPF